MTWPEFAVFRWLAMATSDFPVPKNTEAEGLAMAVLVDAVL